MSLPNPSMDFTAFDPLPASSLDDLVENIEALAAGTGLNDGAVTGTKLADGTVGNEKLDITVGFNMTSTQSISNSATADMVGTSVVDYGSDLNAATGIFTAPVTGFYHFSVGVGITDSTSTTGRLDASLLVNGAAVAHGHGSATSTSSDNTANLSYDGPLTAADQVKVSIGNSTGGTESLTGPSYFSGYLIGR